MVAIVDVEDLALLENARLFGHWKSTSSGRLYGRLLARVRKRSGGDGKIRPVARLVMPGEDVIDHVNNDPCDNRRKNLRRVSLEQNSINRRGTAKTGFKGVTFARGAYQAVCARKYLGRFKAPEEASAAYQKYAAEKYGPEFVNTGLVRNVNRSYAEQFARLAKESDNEQ
jgi:hypothetical protein